MRHVLTFAALVACAAALAEAAPMLSVPPAMSTTPAPQARTSSTLQAVPSSMTIALPVPTAGELSSLRSAPASDARSLPLQIGFARDVPQAQRSIMLSALQWQVAADGGRIAHVDIISPGAAALRLALQTPSADGALSIRLQGSDARANVMGPYGAREIALSVAATGSWWSPVLEGSRATLEIAVAPGVDVGAMTLDIIHVSHLTRAGASLAPKADAKLGTTQACEVNWKCEPPSSALTRAASSVARLIFTKDGGNSYFCSGTLINDSSGSQIPYFFTANHCIDSQAAAGSLNLYWFYDAIDCANPDAPGPYVLQTSGSTLLGRSQAEDWALVRLRAPPPPGVVLAAWNAMPIASGPVVSLHHPQGSLTRLSRGALSGYTIGVIVDDDDNIIAANDFARVIWSEGAVDQGSSGSGLLTYKAAGDFYEVRGGLTGGILTCDSPNAPAYYSRFDQMLPKMRDYLAPGTNPPHETVVVEYYDVALDHYFMTASPIEIEDLDSGVFSGWTRTGLRFLAYTSQVPGSSPVCRFYRAPGFGDSHFYTASPSECSLLVDNPKFPGWLLESGNVFYVKLPDPVTGDCAAGTHPLYRFFHASATNHRYTDDIVIQNRLHEAGADWIAEGYGADAVIMCVPDGE
ncbi:MAG: trypsin-like peptidase domain-containing protein [Betaproteobacteria bacterium]